MNFTPLKPDKLKDSKTLFALCRGKRLYVPDRKLAGTLQKLFKEYGEREQYKGKGGSILVVYPGDKQPAERVVFVGMDKKTASRRENIRRAVSTIVTKSRSLRETSVDVVLPKDDIETAHAVAEGLILSAYRFDKYKTKKKEDEKNLESVRLIGDDADALVEGSHRGTIYAEAACLTRDLVNEPAGYMTPVRMADVAKEITKNSKRIDVKIFDEKEIEKMGMGAFRAVSLGSEQPPRFVHLTYKAPGAKKSVALIGKGITFDSGGLCIKTAEGMMDMKADMAGAASVLGVMSAVERLGLKVNVHGIFPATENMPGGGAFKQRDILRAMNGKTIEVTNTDAEGRLILSDALAYASQLKPDAILDMATLTGACVVALGPKISGLFTPDKGLRKSIVKASRRAGERVWPLPLEMEYFDDMMKSELADMKNSGGRWGGAITAACFLRQFVDPKIAWAHIDIAGPAIFDGGKFYNPPGASGVIVRTLLRYLELQ